MGRTHTHTHIHARTHTHICAHIHTCKQTHSHKSNQFVQLCAPLRSVSLGRHGTGWDHITGDERGGAALLGNEWCPLRGVLRVYMCVYVPICVYVYTCVCMCLWVCLCHHKCAYLHVRGELKCPYPSCNLDEHNGKFVISFPPFTSAQMQHWNMTAPL